MNFRILMALLFVFCSCKEQSTTESLAYTFSINENRDEFNVNLVYNAVEPIDTLEILLPSSYDRFQMKNTVTVTDVKLLSEGELIKVSEDRYEVITAESSFRVSYTIPSLSSDSSQISCLGDEFFIPHVNKKFFHFYGDKGLVIPNYDVEEQRLFDIEIEWENFPEKWHIANDFGIVDSREKQVKEQVLLNNIGNTLFFGGDYRKSEIWVDDKKLNVYLYGKWKFEDKIFLDAIEKIAEAEFNIWDHFYHNKNYVISLTQKGTDDCGKMTGRNMLDSFCFYLPGKFSKEYVPFFYPQLVHEFTHSWIGVDVIANSPYPGKMKWFTEGFTDYYTLKVSRETGFYGAPEYRNKLNEYIRSYMLSPFCTFSIDEFNEGYLFDERLENFIYHKGAVFAFYLDGYIREKTNNQSNLDDLMKALFESTSMKKMNHNLTNDFFTNTAKEALGVDISTLMERYIVNGELIPVISPLIERMETKEETSFDYGFNYIKSIESEIIVDVAENSNAYNAGLRSGQKFLGIEKVTNSPEGEMILKVSDESDVKIVAFKPTGEKVKVPVILNLRQ